MKHRWVLWLFVSFVVSNEFYISTTGTDNEGCGDTNTPCASLNYTLSQASDSDTIYFQEGQYANQSISTITQDNLTIIGLGKCLTNGAFSSKYLHRLQE